MKKLLFTSLCFLLFTTQLIAQSRTVTGTVSAKDDGSPLPGVSVKIKGTSFGAQTNVNGKFSLSVPDDAVLEFSFIGYNTLEMKATDKMVVTLTASANQLGEVVVTGALGIARTRNQQSYAAQQIDGAEVSKQRQTNFIDGLSGKVSGLEITQNNNLGGSTNVIIRGVKSIYGNNQALFVIDGVPVSNEAQNTSTQASGAGGYDYGSPASDINPDDIESVTVLKGAGATALYGSRGANGVILITTKKGKGALNITLNSTLTLSSMDKSTFPKYQNQYGAGYGPFYDDPTGYFFYFDANGDGKPDLVTPTTEDASFGAKFDPNLQVYQWDSFINFPGNNNYGKSSPWVAAKNGPASFFVSPLSTNESINISSGTDKGSFKLGYTNSIDNGIIQGSNVKKNQVDLGATYNITPNLTVGGNINFYQTNGTGRSGTGYDGTNSDNRNVYTNFREWWETNVDVQELKAAYFGTGGTNATWNMADPQDGDYSAIFWNNPYYVTQHNGEDDTRNRYIGNIYANWKATSWLNFTFRAAMDTYAELQEEHYDITSIGVPYYSRFNQNYTESNLDFLANFDKNITKDLNLKGLVGANIRKDHINDIFAQTNGGLIVPGVYALANSVVTPLAPLEDDERKEVDGVFAQATLSWKKFLTLDGTIRRDESSTLPDGNNSYYYPSVSGGFVFSELLKNSAPWLSYGKIRASWAEVGNDAPYYTVLDSRSIEAPFGSATQGALSHTKNNPDLEPERTKSKELGLEMNFFNDRLGFDGSVYNDLTMDEILPVKVSAATGYDFKYLNAGSVRNTGVELSLRGTPIKTKDFNWNVTVNFTHNANKVVSLYKDNNGNEAKQLNLGSYQGGESIDAVLGKSIGLIEGTQYQFLNGKKLVYSNTGTSLDGEYEVTSTSNNIIGNTNPRWLGGINNQFRYKNWTFSFLIDIRSGGDIFSQDMAYGLSDGLYPETAGLNDLGNPVRNPLNQGGGLIRSGVTSNGKANTQRIAADDYTAFGYPYFPDAAFVYDGSYVKLREALLGYSLPESALRALGPIKGVTLQLIGHNLWIIHKNLPYSDPEDNLTSGNLMGIQEGAAPSVRSFSFNLKVTF